MLANLKRLSCARGFPRGRCLRTVCLGVLFVSLAQGNLDAEQFLSIPEALPLCFPDAETFEETHFSLTKDQAKALTKQSGVKTRPREGRYWSARRGDRVLGVVIWDQVLGKHELIDYLVALDPRGSVKQIEVIEYREHYGGQIRNPRWRAQFRGKTAADPFKLNDDIHNISGATLSCRHVTEGVKRVLATYERVVRPQLAAAGGMPGPGTVLAPDR